MKYILPSFIILLCLSCIFVFAGVLNPGTDNTDYLLGLITAGDIASTNAAIQAAYLADIAATNAALAGAGWLAAGWDVGQIARSK